MVLYDSLPKKKLYEGSGSAKIIFEWVHFNPQITFKVRAPYGGGKLFSFTGHINLMMIKEDIEWIISVLDNMAYDVRVNDFRLFEDRVEHYKDVGFSPSNVPDYEKFKWKGDVSNEDISGFYNEVKRIYPRLITMANKKDFEMFIQDY